MFPTISNEIILSQHLGFSARKHNETYFIIICVLCVFPLPQTIICILNDILMHHSVSLSYIQQVDFSNLLDLRLKLLLILQCMRVECQLKSSSFFSAEFEAGRMRSILITFLRYKKIPPLQKDSREGRR